MLTQGADKSKMNVIHIQSLKAMCPPDYHHNGFVAAHALGQMMSWVQSAKIVMLSIFWPLRVCGGGGLSESIKNGKVVTKM